MSIAILQRGIKSVLNRLTHKRVGGVLNCLGRKKFALYGIANFFVWRLYSIMPARFILL